MKKKTKIIIVLLLFVVLIGLSSCKKKIKELEVSGSRMSKNEIQEYIDGYNKYALDISEGRRRKEISSNWYSFSSKFQTKTESENSTIFADISMNGDFYDSFAVMDKKFNLKMNFEMEMTEKEDDKTTKETFKGKISFILVDGLWWIKGKVSYDADDSESFKTTICQKIAAGDGISLDYMGGRFIEIVEVLDTIADMLPFMDSHSGCVVEGLGETFIYKLDAKNSDLYKTKNGYMLEEISGNAGNKSSVTRELYEFEKDSYIPKKIETYNYTKESGEKYSLEVTSTLIIKKKLMGIINAPINKSKYGW